MPLAGHRLRPATLRPRTSRPQLKRDPLGRTLPYNTSFAFDSVVVIESLPAGDLRTGRELFDTVLAPASTADPGLVSTLYEPQTGPELYKVLTQIRRDAEHYHRSPIVHLEMHGDKSGLVMANGTVMPWAELASELTSINTVSRMNLLLVAAMCHGWHMVSLLRPTDRAPAFGIVGTEGDVTAGDLLSTMQRFYQVLVGPSHDFRSAMDVANQGLEYRDWRFKMEGAELWLCRAFTHYVETLSTEESQAQRVNRLVADVARAQNLDVRGTMQVRAALSKAISNDENWFNYYKTKFLMLDLFPENAARFPLGFGDCGERAA